jgi:hypothetical protein
MIEAMLRGTSADRRVAASGAIAGIGGSGVVAYYIYGSALGDRAVGFVLSSGGDDAATAPVST